jgi:hypothetical protein
MSTMNTIWGADHLERSQIWSTMIKKALEDDLEAQKWVNWLSEFPDGAQFNISSVGDFVIDEMQEGVPLPNRRPDTGQFQFVINNSIGNKAAYTDEFMEDDFLAPQVVNATPVKMKRALDEYVESKILALQGEQTLNAANLINGHRHRFAGGNSGRIELSDFAYAKLSLKKANVPQSNLIAIVDPSVGYQLETLSNLVNVSNNPQWEGIISSGITSGMRFIKNVYGFDVYESNYLDESVENALQSKSGAATDFSSIGAKANVFFSASEREILPFMGAWRRMPSLESWRDHDKRTEYHQLTARFGLKLYRPENLIVVPTNPNV